MVSLLKNNYELELLNNSYINKYIHVLLDEFRRKLTEIGGVDDVSSSWSYLIQMTSLVFLRMVFFLRRAERSV